jgi:hypothetical protein
VAEVAERLGKPFMPHQRAIVDVALEIDPETGYLAYDQVVVIGPRQATGKTELLLPVMTHRCVAFDAAIAEWCLRELGKLVRPPDAQSVVYTAQTADEARKKWRRVHLARLEASRYRRDFTAAVQRNQEILVWRNGSTWSPASTTGKTAGTGDTIDLPVIDEAWSRPDSRTELGMRPARLTRLWSQLWVASMIPGLSRAQPGSWPYLKHKRQVGRARVEAGVNQGTAFFDFAAPDGLDPGDPATWWLAMPGLGMIVPERLVASDFADMDLVDFCAEYLGWEPIESAPRWTVIRRETWAALLDRESRIDGTRAFAAEISDDRTSAYILTAGRRADGNWHVEVVEPGFKIAAGAAGIGWMEPRLVELIEDWKPCTTVINPRGPAASLIVPLRNRGFDVLTPNVNETAGACGRLFDATGETAPPERPPETWVFHLGQPELDRAWASARKYELGGGAFTFVHKSNGAAVGPLRGVALAMHGVEVKGPEILPEPEIFF